MRHPLDLRIPLPLLMLFWVALMLLLHRLDSPLFDFDFDGRRTLALVFLVIGVAVAAAGILAFRQIRTTVNPRCPAKASRLVTGGVYRFTRNTMYLGMALALLAWGVYLGSLLPLLFVPLFMLYLTRFQIVPEEQCYCGASAARSMSTAVR